jgi:hypothetical protein
MRIGYIFHANVNDFFIVNCHKWLKSWRTFGIIYDSSLNHNWKIFVFNELGYIIININYDYSI